MVHTTRHSGPVCTENANSADLGGGWRDGYREQGVAGQEAVDMVRAAAAFGDRPHDEALAAAHVAGREHLRHARGERGVALHVRALVELDTELFEQSLALRAEE